MSNRNQGPGIRIAAFVGNVDGNRIAIVLEFLVQVLQFFGWHTTTSTQNLVTDILLVLFAPQQTWQINIVDLRQQDGLKTLVRVDAPTANGYQCTFSKTCACTL